MSRWKQPISQALNRLTLSRGGWGRRETPSDLRLIPRRECSKADRALQRSSKGSRVCTRTATTAASSSSDRTALFRCVGPIGRSRTPLPHLLPVDPEPLRVAIGPYEGWICARMRAVVVALPCRTCAIGYTLSIFERLVRP
jgi:hypothetical protein